ncbi:AraC-type DNA-binding protein [Clostridium cavendishii DSM 21758]|uniref:AraC-type DNA-binding protein n=1 Tax=Clostridium cavendishii DSM 21758 TaxID=1121302 RepID=A0A1M6BDG4_9CLOT|nr:AraC family transcriptional regulator [Clostridium cavendishii]SHI46598.1 AraC-type DNA-binding protein [Clostridium cavendishii DSM 21758]
MKSKRGYLYKDFKLFHLKDNKKESFELHYHEFNKIIVFLSGKVNYLIEGKSYNLKPGDILFINNYEVHRPIIDSSEEYERIIFWVNSDFLIKNNSNDFNLLKCFEFAAKNKINLLRLENDDKKYINELIRELELEVDSKVIGSSILSSALFIKLMVNLNRFFLNYDLSKEKADISFNEIIQNILFYINNNLKEDLSIDSISNKFFISKYYLMHKFKNETGYTLHSYINQKRMILACEYIKQGKNIHDVSEMCGFNDYSTFIRVFKKFYKLSPKEYKKDKF